jgi:pilus biogenesis CpaD protein
LGRAAIRLSALALAILLGAVQTRADSPWLAEFTNQELTAVDGSKLTLTPSEGRVVLTIASPGGTEQKSTFTFLNDRLGTVADEGDKDDIAAVFRQSDIGFEITYGDGRSASLVANTADGLTLTRRTPSGESGCMSWYPAGHAFSAEERRAAVAAYAASLGVPDTAPAPKKGRKAARVVAAVPVVHPPPCAPALRAPKMQAAGVEVRSAVVHAVDAAPSPPPAAAPQAAPAPAPKVDAAAPSYRSIKLPFTTPDTGLAPQDAARLSIFVAEFLTAGTSAMSIVPPNGANNDAATAYVRDRLVAQGVPRDHIVIGTRAPGDADARVELGYLSASSGSLSASSCLSVEADGPNLGFRNHCAFNIQYAYCLLRSADPTLGCDTGAKAGQVAPNAFSALMAGPGAEHDVRWVACNGDLGRIAAHIDRAEPPAGRCEKIN